MQRVIPKFANYEILGEIGHDGLGVVSIPSRGGLRESPATIIVLPTSLLDRGFTKPSRLDARSTSLPVRSTTRLVEQTGRVFDRVTQENRGKNVDFARSILLSLGMTSIFLATLFSGCCRLT
jgi:hypothetical protein